MLNKVELIGRLGRDPEMIYTQSGLQICKWTMATTSMGKDKDEKTEWHQCVAFGRLAEICGQYLVKGKLIYVDGRITTSSWEQDGVKKYKTEIIINNMLMLGSRGDEPPVEIDKKNIVDGDDDSSDIPF